jgi:hypothetical protein
MMGEGEGDYRTSIDRVGLALACGSGLAGLAASILVVLGGEESMRAALFALLIGGIFAALAITVIAGPVWLLLHLSGQRGPAAAALSGAAIGFLLMLAAGLGGGGDEPWLHAFGGALLAAALAGAIALVMWRVAYRRRAG